MTGEQYNAKLYRAIEREEVDLKKIAHILLLALSDERVRLICKANKIFDDEK